MRNVAWRPVSENHWPWASGHCIPEVMTFISILIIISSIFITNKYTLPLYICLIIYLFVPSFTYLYFIIVIEQLISLLIDLFILSCQCENLLEEHEEDIIELLKKESIPDTNLESIVCGEISGKILKKFMIGNIICDHNVSNSFRMWLTLHMNITTTHLKN